MLHRLLVLSLYDKLMLVVAALGIGMMKGRWTIHKIVLLLRLMIEMMLLRRGMCQASTIEG